jgi:hypothetical protein
MIFHHIKFYKSIFKSIGISTIFFLCLYMCNSFNIHVCIMSRIQSSICYVNLCFSFRAKFFTLCSTITICIKQRMTCYYSIIYKQIYMQLNAIDFAWETSLVLFSYIFTSCFTSYSRNENPSAQKINRVYFFQYACFIPG